jgi:outer membrane receptor protein involved in Fe transport
MYGAPQLRGVGFTLICFALTERLDLIAAIHHRPRPELRATHCVGGSETAYTGALNFDLNDELGFFVRYTKGFLFPHFDDIRENRNTVDEVKQLEGGVKFSRDGLDLYATAFFNENDAFSSTVGGVLPPTAFTTEASGIELDGTLQLGAIRINVIGTLQETEITDSTTPADVGNQVLRQPEWQMRISPSYVWEADDFNATFYVSATLVGDRFDDNANTVELEGYEKIDLGVLAEFTGGLFVQAHADNINDSEGITEGDPRDPSAPNPFSAAPSCSA